MFKILTREGIAHAFMPPGEAACGVGIDLRLDVLSDRWHRFSEAARLDCPACREKIERMAAVA